MKIKQMHSRIIALALAILTCLCGCSFLKDNYEIVTIETSYAFDVWDYRNLAVFYKYIFVGRLECEADREYDEDGVPDTFYKVTPLMNIQGELELGKELTYKKQCGISEDEKYCFVLSGDILPEEGKLYIFSVNAIDNGEILYSSGANSTIALEENITVENLTESALVTKMIDACEKPAYMSDYFISVSNIRSMYDVSENPTVSTEELLNSNEPAKLLNKSSPQKTSLDDAAFSKLMGNYNYFFVGTVGDNGKFGITEEGVPYVEYTVTPIYSIVDGTIINYREQKFVEERSIKFIKYGGLSVYGNDVEITRNDVFPEADNLYIFSCTATANGESLYSYSPYAVVPLEESISDENISEASLVKRFENARKEKHEVSQPVMKEFGVLQLSNHTLRSYIDELYNQEIALAEKENRDPVFDYEDEIYKYPDWLK